MWDQGAWKEGQKEDKWAFLKKVGEKKKKVEKWQKWDKRETDQYT